MNNAIFIIKTLLSMCRPIIKNTVLFRSFNGQYNDNPKYVSEELHQRRPDVKIVWATGDSPPESFPDYVMTVPIDSSEYARYIARAEVVVDNYCGCRTNYLGSNNPVKRMVFRLLSRKRRGQLCISTWHGTPLKRIALDEPQYRTAKFARGYFNSDLILSGSDLSGKAYRTAFAWRGEILDCGTPRNDILLRGEPDVIKKRLGLPENKRVLLFAPTFRNDVFMSGIYQLRELDIPRLLSALSERFGGEWRFVFRSHNLVTRSVSAEGVFDNGEIINGNASDDMAEYLLTADVLLTDYSSSMFDFMLTGRPIFLYAPDLEEYKNSERGFYLDIEETPPPLAKTAEDVLKNIKLFDKESYEKKVDDFLRKIGNKERGEASRITVDRIIKHLEEV